MYKTYYLIIENAEIFSATSNSNLFTSGFPALTNFLGFAEFFKYILNKDAEELIKKSSISVVINDFNYNPSHNKFMLYKKTDTISNRNVNASTIDEKTVKLNLNLYIKLKIDIDNFVNDSELETIKYIDNIINKNKYSLKIAGGQIFNAKFKITKNKEDIIKSLKKKKHSYILEKSPFDIDNLTRNETIEILNGVKKNIKKQLLLQVGYNILEDFSNIKNSRNNAQNALANPILNFVQTRKVYSYLFNNNLLEIENYFEQVYNNKKLIIKTTTI